MISAFQLSVLGAAAIAISGAAFGVGLSRVLWADDLSHAQSLRLIWDKSEKALNSIIDSQKRSIDSQDRIIESLRSQIK